MAPTCAKTHAASMNKRVEVQLESATSDGQGGFENEWATTQTLWASIEPLKGYERMQAMQLANPITHKVRMRYNSGVTTKHRLLYSGRVFQIKEVINENEADAFLTLRCVEG